MQRYCRYRLIRVLTALGNFRPVQKASYFSPGERRVLIYRTGFGGRPQNAAAKAKMRQSGQSISNARRSLSCPWRKSETLVAGRSKTEIWVTRSAASPLANPYRFSIALLRRQKGFKVTWARCTSPAYADSRFCLHFVAQPELLLRKVRTFTWQQPLFGRDKGVVFYLSIDRDRRSSIGCNR